MGRFVGVLWIGLAGLAGLWGCSFSSDDPDCSSQQPDCPAGQVCLDGHCVDLQEDGGYDGSDDGGVADGDSDGGGDAAGGRELTASVLLGEGGFFGVSGMVLGDVHGNRAAFAVGAHYANIGTEEARIDSGRVYLFDSGELPSDLSQASLVLEAPDRMELGGFGYSLCAPCDLNDDGQLDLPVGNHLYYNPGYPNSGRVVVFYGDDSGHWSMASNSSHRLPDGLIESSDVMGQSIVCEDVTGDGIADLVVGGQNAGADDTGLIAIFEGREGGPDTFPSQLLTPSHAASHQYFGASSLWTDLDGDGLQDLAVGAWGLIKGGLNGPHIGGVVVFAGGDDWSHGPSFTISPPGDTEIQAGGSMSLVGPAEALLLAVGAPDLGTTGPDDLSVPGGILLYAIGSPEFRAGTVLQALKAPEGFEGDGFGQSFAWIPDYFGADRGALLVGMKHADASADQTGTGVVAVYALNPNGSGFVNPPGLLLAPDPQGNDAFGGTIVPLPDLTGDGLADFWVGMEAHVEGDIYTGTQTGGVVFFH